MNVNIVVTSPNACSRTREGVLVFLEQKGHRKQKSRFRRSGLQPRQPELEVWESMHSLTLHPAQATIVSVKSLQNEHHWREIMVGQI